MMYKSLGVIIVTSVVLSSIVTSSFLYGAFTVSGEVFGDRSYDVNDTVINNVAGFNEFDVYRGHEGNVDRCYNGIEEDVNDYIRENELDGVKPVSQKSTETYCMATFIDAFDVVDRDAQYGVVKRGDN